MTVLGLTHLRENDHEVNIPLSVVSAIQQGCKYTKAIKPIEDTCLSTCLPNEQSLIDNFVCDIGSKFLEAVLCNHHTWVLVTHVDVFLQEQPLFDRCAHNRRGVYNSMPKASIATNAYAGSTSWQELRIQWGNVQILCLGGLYGEIGSAKKMAFLGPSVHH